jgi:hypothetical protein
MLFEYDHDSVSIEVNTRMQRYFNEMMAPQRAGVIDFYFAILCKRLISGAGSFIVTNELRPNATARSSLETAMRTLWMLQAYKEDHQNLPAFSIWCSDASVHENQAMTYFQSMPFYGHTVVNISTNDYSSLGEYAESALEARDVSSRDVSARDVSDIQTTHTLVTNITRGVCTSLFRI